MDMSLVFTDSKVAFSEQLAQLLMAKCHPQEVEQLQEFAALFFEHYPIEELRYHEINDVVGMLKSSYAFLGSYKQRRAKVNVFNPSLEADGWLSNNTIVTVHYNDVPFIIDSVRMALSDRGITIKGINNLVVETSRDVKGNLVYLSKSDEANSKEAKELLIYLEINRHHKTKDLSAISSAIRKAITDVNLVNNHYSKMVEQLQGICENTVYANSEHSDSDVIQAKQFLAWLMVNNFTFLGYAYYALEGVGKQLELGKSYGVLGKKSDITNYFPSDTDKLKKSSDPLLSFNKSPIRSTIHRRSYPDHITIKAYDSSGKFVGVHHLLGLYTSQVYRASVNKTPLLREKAQHLYQNIALSRTSYNGKVLRQVLETYPRDELFQSNIKELEETLMSIAQINERSVVRLFMRKSTDQRFVSAMVYVPRDKFSTSLRQKVIQLLSDAVGAESQEFYSYYSESILSRTYIIFRLRDGKPKLWSKQSLEECIQALTSTWSDRLEEALLSFYGDEKGQLLSSIFKDVFPLAYQSYFSTDAAVSHIKMIQSVNESHPITLHLSQPEVNNKEALHFTIFNYATALPLSDVIAVLERMNLKVIGEQRYEIVASKGEGQTVWLHDFILQTDLRDNVDITTLRPFFEEAFTYVWGGRAENDFFNGLVLSASMSWREVAVLRAYGAYMKQTMFPFGKKAITNTLMAYPDIAQQLMVLFTQRFDPSATSNDTHRLHQAILSSLEHVANLNHDRILRHYAELIQGTLRTNYYQLDEDGEPKSYCSFKFNTRVIPDIPEPRPMYEIFVYSPRLEGVHLRGGKVAHGGLRWSDRHEDFRTEILGLVKSQNVKNAVIVPSGAKGGFVAKKASMGQGHDPFVKEGIACYRLFISGLLDITDNVEKGRTISPKNVVRHDGYDTYLAVAADKGTATFSDIANEISLKYNHWLGDAFASGGSHGYDHKGMGITAKGAWESIKRHFKEKGINVQKEEFTVVGIGDMAGDVFGNGMLISEHTCLMAAFNHLHIFIDPSPNAAQSYQERKRLFNTPGTNWADYNQKLISKGGGVFLRSDKSITLTPEMQVCFDIKASKMAPNDFILALLKAPVDIIWNGGIGTYVKSRSESHADIGDKANESVRINGADLRCKVFGEGGNLGISQLGRVEYSMRGGSCNTDFIDNSAGVNCSDHEVNIKILLADIMANGILSEKQRNHLLANMTDTVSSMVLKKSYDQTQAISLAEKESFSKINEYHRLINALESSGRLNRALEFIPSNEELIDRLAKNHSLTRPELSILHCYVKVELTEALAVDDIANNDYLSSLLEKAFPPQLVKRYKHNIHHHILRKDIIATQLANDMVDNMGMTFCHSMMESTGESASSVAMAYMVARDIFQLDDFQSTIKALDYKISADDQLSLFASMVERVRRGTRWLLRNQYQGVDLQETVNTFRVELMNVVKETPSVLGKNERRIWQDKCDYFQKLGLDSECSNMMAMPAHLFSGLGVVEAALQSQRSIDAAVAMHHLLGDKLGVYWFADAVTGVKVENFWQLIAKESFIDDIDKVLRVMTISLLRLARKDCHYEEILQLWMQDYPVIVTRWRNMAHDLQTSQAPDFAMFSIAMRELTELANVCQPCKS